MYTPTVQNKISEPHQIVNLVQINNEKTNYLKNILEAENKCQYWMDKYDELHDKCTFLYIMYYGYN